MDQRNLSFMFYGLAAAWAVIAIFVVSLVLRERKLKQQLETLARMIDDKETKQ
jgi:uncharacterized membrane protein YciS (DUF1049 family)